MPLAASSLALGFGTGLSLIVAIGAQNAYVLRVGLAGRHRVVTAVVAVCALSDAALVTAGTLGIGAVVARAPAVLDVLRALGVAFLLAYGALALRRAARPGGSALVSGAGDAYRLGPTLLAVAAFTWLNPHVYLDTVLFLGSLANQQGPAQRWWWVGGAVAASLAWFASLGFGARLLRPLFARPAAWRLLDAAIGVVMVALALRLALAGGS